MLPSARPLTSCWARITEGGSPERPPAGPGAGARAHGLVVLPDDLALAVDQLHDVDDVHGLPIGLDAHRTKDGLEVLDLVEGVADTLATQVVPGQPGGLEHHLHARAPDH